MPLLEPSLDKPPNNANMQTACRRFQAEDIAVRRPRLPPRWPFCLACSVRPRHWPKSSHRSRCHVVPCPAAERATFTPCKAVLAVSQTRILASPARTVYYLQLLDAVIAGDFDCSRVHQEFNQTDSRMFRLFRTQTHTSNSMSSFGYNQTPVSVLQASKHSHLLT